MCLLCVVLRLKRTCLLPVVLRLKRTCLLSVVWLHAGSETVFVAGVRTCINTPKQLASYGHFLGGPVFVCLSSVCGVASVSVTVYLSAFAFASVSVRLLENIKQNKKCLLCVVLRRKRTCLLCVVLRLKRTCVLPVVLRLKRTCLLSVVWLHAGSETVFVAGLRVSTHRSSWRATATS